MVGLLLLTVIFPQSAGAIQVGQAAPEFSLSDINGTVYAGVGLRGNVVIINFWATWCPPCAGEVKVLNNIYKKYETKGLKVFGITKDTVPEVKKFEASHPIAYPVLIDSRSTAHILYGVLPIPVTFLIDSSGVVVKKYIGPPNQKDLESDIREILR
ncbi:MAG: TlpA disulfide reductase family protein [Nitrospiraceae bacterium]|nr:TlpA disulfide reductase family protein [Nitrospiraceae bacterium]